MFKKIVSYEKKKKKKKKKMQNTYSNPAKSITDADYTDDVALLQIQLPMLAA